MFKSLKMSGYKVLLTVGALTALASSISLFAPLDLMITALANKVRAYDAAGNIVIINIDEYSTAHNLATPIPADHALRLLTSLVDSGAKKIILSEPITADQQDSTQILREYLAQHPEKIHIVQSESINRVDYQPRTDRYVQSPTPIHNKHLTLFWRGVERVAYSVDKNGVDIISAATAITGVRGRSDERFYIDYALKPESIPRHTLSGSFGSGLNPELQTQIKGKNVILGYETGSQAKLYTLLGDDRRYGLPTIMAYSANTLQQGRPIELNWPWPFAAGLMITWLIMGSQKIYVQILVFAISLAGGFCAMITLNTFNITFPISSLMILIMIVTPISITSRIKENTELKLSMNPDSGLASVNTLRLKPMTDMPLIAARISGFDEIVDLLPPEDRKNLTSRISSLATADGQIWQGENGHFYWFSKKETLDSMADHLGSLALIMRNGFSIGSLPISLKTSFGVDLRYAAHLSDRIIGASLSAKRAASQDQSWMVYEEGDKAETAWSVSRLSELDLAISGGQIRTALQPKFDLNTGVIVGVEALARWTHPIRGNIRPDEFVKAAEDGGCIKELTIAVLHSALPSVEHAIFENPEFILSVNITPSLLRDPTLCGSIASLLATYGVSPANLILEVTESTVFSNDDVSITSIHELVAMGIKLSIDDYGTGNSTLEYLRNIPAKELKIDQKFVRDILRDEDAYALVASTIKLAHELKMTVVAEGVEDSQTLEKLRDMGCDLAQGYLISRPLTPKQFLNFMTNLNKIPVRQENS